MSEIPKNLYEHRQQMLAKNDRYVREGTVPVTSYTRPKPTSAEAVEAARLNAARALPDELFEDDPKVQRLRATLAAKRALIEKRIPVRDWLSGQLANLDAMTTKADGAVVQAILEDAVNQDGAFTKTRAALAELEFSRAVRAYAEAAYSVVEPSDPGAQHALCNARDDAQSELWEHLFGLKKAHVDAQVFAGHSKEGGQ